MTRREYCLAGQNCEQASNIIIHGIEYSQQVAERPRLAEVAGRIYAANKNKNSSFILKDEIQRVNNLLRETHNQRAKDIRDEHKVQVEISTRNNCQIM